MTFTTHHLEFTATTITSLALEAQPGSSLRGAIVGALWGRFCVNKAASTCAACPLSACGPGGHPVCPVAQLIAPMRAEGETGGEQRPRPYVTRPPTGRSYTPGEQLTFGLALFGGPAQLFPYIVMAAQALADEGLGRPLSVNGGRRGRVQIERIDAVSPLSDERETLFSISSGQVRAPGLPIGPAEVAVAAASLPADRISLQFRTPLRLIEAKQLVKRFTARPFIQRLIERLNELGRAYGGGPLVADHRLLLEIAETVVVADDATRWVDVVSASTRQGGRTPIGGLVGSVTLTGDLAPLRDLFSWGTLIHVGKNAVKGDGWYTLDAA